MEIFFHKIIALLIGIFLCVVFAIVMIAEARRLQPWVEVKAYYITEEGLIHLYDENFEIKHTYTNNFKQNRNNFLVIELLNPPSGFTDLPGRPFSGTLVVIRGNKDPGLEIPIFYLPADMDKPDYIVIPPHDAGAWDPEAPPYWYWKEYGYYKNPIWGRRWGADTEPTN